MTTPDRTATASRMPDTRGPYGRESGANLADILERVLDKGVVIAGDIRINLLDIELLTIKLRLVVASVDKAKEMGIDWWEEDPALNSRARRRELSRENARLRARLEELEDLGAGTAHEPERELDPEREPDRDRELEPQRERKAGR